MQEVQVIIDATTTSVDISYLTGPKLLNEASKKSEKQTEVHFNSLEKLSTTLGPLHIMTLSKFT